MAATLSPNQSQTQVALRAFVLAILPTGVDVIQYADNGVSEPSVPDFVIMTPILRSRLETNIVTSIDGDLNGGTAGGSTTSLQPTKVTIQLDVHGPNSADNAQLLSTMLRDPLGVALFKTSGFDVTPLYAEDPRQVPFVNGENQFEKRWTVDAVMQVNQTVTSQIAAVAQQFAAEVQVTPATPGI